MTRCNVQKIWLLWFWILRRIPRSIATQKYSKPVKTAFSVILRHARIYKYAIMREYCHIFYIRVWLWNDEKQSQKRRKVLKQTVVANGCPGSIIFSTKTWIMFVGISTSGFGGVPTNSSVSPKNIIEGCFTFYSNSNSIALLVTLKIKHQTQSL